MIQFVPHSQNASIAKAIPLIARERPPHIIAIDPPGDAAEAVALVGMLWVRHHQWQYDFNEGHVRFLMETGVNPDAEARRFVAECQRQAWYPHAFGILSPPAMARGDIDITGWAIDFQLSCLSLFGVDGKQFAVCGVSSQNDGYAVPGATYYHCQEYQKGRLRYREWFPQTDGQFLIISECGHTNLENDPIQKADSSAPHGDDIGFQGGHGVEGNPNYLAEMEAYRNELSKDAYVLTAAVYGVGMNEDWSTFEHVGTDAERLFATTPPEAPTTPTQPMEDTMPTQADIDNAKNVIWGVGRVLKGEQSLPGDTLPNLGQQLQDAAIVLGEAARPNS